MIDPEVVNSLNLLYQRHTLYLSPPMVVHHHDCFATGCDYIEFPSIEVLNDGNQYAEVIRTHSTISRSLYRWRMEQKNRKMRTIRQLNRNGEPELRKSIFIQRVGRESSLGMWEEDKVTALDAWGNDEDWLL